MAQRLLIQFIAVTVFLSLSCGFLLFLVQDGGQGIGGGGAMICVRGLAGILLFSALATLLRRFLQGGVGDKEKRKQKEKPGA